MGGVGLGVTAMIVVLSVMNGFECELKKRMVNSELHILIEPTRETEGFSAGFVSEDLIPRAYWERLAQKPMGKNLDQVWPVVTTEAILKSGRRVSGVTLKGITAERLAHLQTQVIEAAEASMLVSREGSDTIRYPGVFLGKELAFEMGLLPGDQVTVISPTETQGPLDGIPRLKNYVVEGIYHSGFPEQELHTVYATLSSVRSFLKRAHVLSQWELTVKNFDQAESLAQYLSRDLIGLRVRDWMTLNAHLFASLKLERLAMFIILAFIIVVASFNIVTTLTLMVLEKKREISILKAMGAAHHQVATIFLSEGLLIGLSGIGGGLVLGFALCRLLKRYEFIQLPEIYYDRNLPVTFDVQVYVTVALCALLIVILATVYPSRRAARLHPIEGIRLS